MATRSNNVITNSELVTADCRDREFYKTEGLESVIIEETIVEPKHRIGAEAFCSCPDLTYVFISDASELDSDFYIGPAAFHNCHLESIDILPDTGNITFGANAFLGADIGRVNFGQATRNGATINASVTEGDNGEVTRGDIEGKSTRVVMNLIDFWFYLTFENVYANPLSVAHSLYSVSPSTGSLTHFTSIQLPQIVKPYALAGCDATHIDFAQCSTIGDFAFYGMSQLQDVTIGSYAEYVGVGIFMNAGLRSVTIDKGFLTQIPDHTFDGCHMLSVINPGQLYNMLPNNIWKIGKRAFAETNLQFIALPSVVDIADDAFEGCSHDLLFIVEDGSANAGYIETYCKRHGFQFTTKSFK